jgi:NitT/TauT family transport system substrate-binding protein
VVTRRGALRRLVGVGAGVLGLTACQPAKLVRRDTTRGLVLRVNYFGSAAYASLLWMRDRKLLEKAVPGLSVEWKPIPDLNAVNDALANGGLDVAAGPPTAFLMAREAGMPARLLAGLSNHPCSIVGRVGLHTLSGLRAGERIAVPDEKSYEAAVLELAALREFGDALALKGRMVGKAHADAVVALRAGTEISAHVSPTPYREVELDGSELTRVVDDTALFLEPATAALTYALPALRERNGPLLATFVDVLGQAIGQVLADPTEAARLIGEPDELKLPRERVAAFLTAAGWRPSTRLAGVTRIAELWRQTDRLHKTPVSWRDLAFDGVDGD